MGQLEAQIAEWRRFVDESPAVDGRDAEELEAHLRDQISDLSATGLTADEAFLVAVKRMGNVHELSHEFAREHSGRLWRQLVLSGGGTQEEADRQWPVVLSFAVAAAFSIQIARLISGFPDEGSLWFIRNAGFFVLPLLAGWFGVQRRISSRQWLWTVALFGVAAVVVNVYPYDEVSSTELLVMAHVPVMLWFLVAYPYAGSKVESHDRRMHFVRFTGEWFIYYVLIALGGGVLTGLTGGLLEGTGVDLEQLALWVLPAGAAGAVIVAAWLVESKQTVIENMAPVLTMIFTPLFAVTLAVSVVIYAMTGFGGVFDRELLGLFDALMVVVLGLVLYGMSAREPSQPPGWTDRVQLVAVVSALILDLIVLGAMVARIGELGFTPNRTAALGLNLVLLVNLVRAAWLSTRFLMGKTTFYRLERWQTSYLPVFAVWAATVVVVLPPLFGFN